MSDRPIDRQAWATLIAGLIASETGGKKATFARLVGVDPKTIGHWLAGTVEVSEASVRRVATACHRRPMELLVQVGYYQQEELSQPEPLTDEEIDEEIRFIKSNKKLSVTQKAEIIKYVLDQAEQDRKRRLEIAQWMIRQAEAG